MPVLVLQNVKDPTLVKELLHKTVEEIKIRRRVRVGEIMSNGCNHDVEDDDELDDDDLDDNI